MDRTNEEKQQLISFWNSMNASLSKTLEHCTDKSISWLIRETSKLRCRFSKIMKLEDQTKGE